jgi:type IV pilus assembly protein PilB
VGLIRAKRKDDGGTAAPSRTAKQAALAGVEAAVADVAEGPRHSGTPLGELLLGRGMVSEEQLKDALLQQTASGERLGSLLVQLGLVGEREMVRVLADQLGMEVVDLRTADLDEEVVALLPEETARRLCAIPLAREGQRIDVAVGDPQAEFLTGQLIDVFKAPVRLVLAARSDVERAIDGSYRSTAKLGDALRVFEERMDARRAQLEHEPQPAKVVVDENAPVVQVVNLVLEQAVRDRASDVHIEPQEDRLRVRVRTDGALHEVSSLPLSMGPSLVSRIKVMADMNIVERRRPQDGQMAVTVAGREMDVRVATTGTVFGEKAVLRLLDKSRALLRLNELGMPVDTAQRYSDLIRSPYGMVICAGPTGSGKTTTLYATLSEIANDEINVTTIEDPVEYVFPTINQIQINEQAGITFAAGLRSILRQDPDAVLVGEIRDVETARIAVQAALTGHFVLSSLHATDTAAAMHRFLDMGIEPFLVASSLLGVVGQRLVRRLCPHCAERYTPTPEELAFYRKAGGDASKREFVRGAGCNFCGQTGYFERVGIYEVMRVTDDIKELIVAAAPHEAIRALAVEHGMRTLQDQAVRLVTEDETTLAEVLRTVQVV